MRITLIVPCLLALIAHPLVAVETVPAAPPIAAPASTGPGLTPAERAPIDRLVDALFATGVPDTRGALVLIGEIVVSEPAPEDDPRHHINSISPGDPEERVEDGVRTSTWRGTHLLLKDGRYLLQLTSLVGAKSGRTITPATDIKRLTPAEAAIHLMKTRKAEEVLDVDEQAWLAIFTPEARKRMMELRPLVVPIAGLNDNFWNAGLALPLLYRAGFPGAAEQMYLNGLAQLWPSYARYRDRVAPLILDHENHSWREWQEGEADESERDPKKWMEAHKGAFSIPDASETNSTQIADWFRQLAVDKTTREAFGFTLAQVKQHSLAFLPQARRAKAQADLDLLMAGLALPDKVPANADLATQLQSWNPSEGYDDSDEPDDDNQLSEAMIAQMPAEVQAEFRKRAEARQAWKPSEADAAGLVALLGDPRPCRWLDEQTPRTLGDNALRALSRLMRFDPRLLVGRNPQAPWTAEERNATATAIRAWWTGLGGKPMGESKLAAIDKQPYGVVATLLTNSKPEQRDGLLDRVAASLPAVPDQQVDSGPLAKLLAVCGTHAACTAKVATWPVTGTLRPLLAVWHDRQGRPAELDALIDELVKVGDTDDMSAGKLNMALAQAMARPSTARLQRCLALAAGPPTDRRTWAVLGAASNQQSFYDEDWSAIGQLSSDSDEIHFGNRGNADQLDTALAIPLAVACTMLADRRAIGDDLVKVDVHGDWGQLRMPGLSLGIQLAERNRRGQAKQTEQNPRPAPTGLRICDAAAAGVRQMTWRIGEHDLGNQPTKLWDPVETRDLALLQLAEAFASKARPILAAAKLPDVLPAAAPVDTKALF